MYDSGRTSGQAESGRRPDRQGKKTGMHDREDISVKENAEYGTLAVTAPYDREFSDRAVLLRGRWKSENRTWTFPDACRDQVMQAVRDIYGWTGPGSPKAILRLRAGSEGISKDRDGIRVMGRTVVRAWGRDSGAALGPQCALVDGGMGSGGSVRRWKTLIYPGSVFDLELPLEAARVAERRIEERNGTAQPQDWDSAKATERDPEKTPGYRRQNMQRIVGLMRRSGASLEDVRAAMESGAASGYSP